MQAESAKCAKKYMYHDINHNTNLILGDSRLPEQPKFFIFKFEFLQFIEVNELMYIL